MHCLVLAGGGSNPADPLFAVTQGKPKSLLTIGTQTLLERVIAAIQDSRFVDEVVIVGMNEQTAAEAGLQFKRPVHFLPDQGGMVANMRTGADYVATMWPGTGIILGSSADIPTITGDIVDDFIASCAPWDRAIYYNFVTRATMEARFPGSSRTYTQLADMEVAGGDMVMAQVDLIHRNEELVLAATNARKYPWRIARLVGFGFLVRFLLHRVTLADVQAAAERAVGQPVAVMLSPHAELAMDIDKPSQLELLRRDLSGSR